MSSSSSTTSTTKPPICPSSSPPTEPRCTLRCVVRPPYSSSFTQLHVIVAVPTVDSCPDPPPPPPNEARQSPQLVRTAVNDRRANALLTSHRTGYSREIGDAKPGVISLAILWRGNAIELYLNEPGPSPNYRRHEYLSDAGGLVPSDIDLYSVAQDADE